MTVPTPDTSPQSNNIPVTTAAPGTSPGDEIEEILDDAISIGYQAGKQYGYHSENMRHRAKKEAKDRLNRLMLTRLRAELADVVNTPHGEFGNNPHDAAYYYGVKRLAAIDAQLNKEETDGDSN